MKHLEPHRVASALLLGTILCVALCGCEDDGPTALGGSLRVVMEQPLTLSWSGKELGVPFRFDGVFSARANTRVSWRFRLEAKPADPDDPRFNWSTGLGPPLYKQTATFQDAILFSWSTDTVFSGRNFFAAGDTCTATVTLTPQLAAEESDEAVFTFVIGGP
ncbi:MAG: hypothetical protein ACE5G2_06985 [Candidatus Krumholzibacteriia bacterium]